MPKRLYTGAERLSRQDRRRAAAGARAKPRRPRNRPAPPTKAGPVTVRQATPEEIEGYFKKGSTTTAR